MSTTAPVEFGSLTCPACGAALGPYGLDAVQEAHCPACRATLRGQLFPAWWKAPAKPEAKFDRAMEGEAVCFFHPANRAVLACDACGRFVCTICDLPVGTRHLCPVCLSKGLGKEKLPEILPRRFLWARTALLFAILPILCLIWPAWVISGGTAVILAILSWWRPVSLVRGRQRWAAIFAIVFGIVQMAGWFGVITLISYANSHSAK